MNVLGYLQGVASELRKVTWPTTPLLVRYMISVIIGVALATVFIWAVDFVFIKALGLLIN